MKCDKCNNEAIQNQANWKQFWYCRTCKEEVFEPIIFWRDNCITGRKGCSSYIDRAVSKALNAETLQKAIKFIEKHDV